MFSCRYGASEGQVSDWEHEADGRLRDTILKMPTFFSEGVHFHLKTVLKFSVSFETGYYLAFT